MAWPILERRADAFMAIDDAAAIATAQRLSAATADSPGLDVGVSGAAGVAGLVELVQHKELAAALELGTSARVLAIGTEQGTGS